jgi:hypothetical protein
MLLLLLVVGVAVRLQCHLWQLYLKGGVKKEQQQAAAQDLSS